MKARALDLCPTQFSIGIHEVQKRVKHISELNSKDRGDFLREKAVPFVIGPGPDKAHFIIDRHHLVRACWEMDIDEVFVDMKADLSHLKPAEFWQVMEKSHWVHLFDQFGKGPHSPELLPDDIRGLADDPYRSLAWSVRREGGYEKSGEAFAEFKWAEFLRAKIKIGRGDDAYKKAVKEALEVCKTHECHKLPGFMG